MPSETSSPAAEAGSSLRPDSEGLHAIANTPRRDRRADVVFVHGLAGGSHATWTHGRPGDPGYFFWPERLGGELPDWGIWSLGYEAGVVPWFGADGMPIADRAVNLTHRLLNAGLGSRLLVFITHSMGGLMVKEIVIQSQTAGDPEWSRLVDQVAAIVFCATPHRGSHVAGMAKALSAVLGTRPHVREMAPGEQHLDRLHQQFVTWQADRATPVQAYAERLGMKRHRWWVRWLPALVVVPPTSADPQIAGCLCIPCHEDHLTLVKPRDPQHDVYAGVLRFLRNLRLPSPVTDGGPTRPVSPAPPGRIRELIRQILREEGLLPARH